MSGRLSFWPPTISVIKTEVGTVDDDAIGVTFDRPVREAELFASLGVDGEKVKPGPFHPLGEQALKNVAGLKDPQCLTFRGRARHAAPRVGDASETWIAEH